MASTVVLVTGANRGLGEGLVERFLALPNHTVIAVCRDPAHTTAKALLDLGTGEGSSLVMAKCDASVEEDPATLVKDLQSKHDIDHLDIVVANAGIVKAFPLVKDVKRSEILEHIEINVFGVLSLYQATRSLLQKSQAPHGPVLALMGSTAGSLERQPSVPNAAYGASKAMLHWYGMRINSDEEWLASFVLEPGFVQTDMGNSSARAFGMEKAITTVDDSCDGMFKVLNTATKEHYGGKLVDFNGEIQTW
ncbi:hypothetical protein AAFC00_006096 [Neodothiora populina]